ncbi:ABC transporter permease [Meiothermus ruber]|jgi:peptide/nickel transport system permease protein|uniref:Binding-protein-dependent transport system inner membrane protein n=1 Tax=Meiothermus ruber (strain ATCC 35948 / DSM 1279 / VKM B-1258 / 21) TaxID=504728 RepID=D3PR25_MEIRD|nr:ABC transporter permease [Meiothermus ruber]ADD27908.1 binding-protein-dependent transport systems inner membrane component [Meiothermus ruber DSM 1279]AGK04377.1 binding-protein-dependent transport system inner membrane protein [Meiothermus ruber DSM 1279]MCL6530462.1 ABC transporter permease [Meiothermus ruber]
MLRRAQRNTTPQANRSFFQQAWIRFKRHPLARLGAVVLLVFYLGALFADFLAPYPEEKSFRDFTFASPTQIFWRDEQGRLTRPYVCASERRRNPETFRVEVITDCEKGRYPIYFFVKGEPYRFLGLIPTDLRLMGGPWLLEDKAKLFLWGTDDFGRDIWGRIWFGARISLTIGIFAVALALVIGIFMGSISGYYAGRPVTFSIGILNPEFWAFIRGSPWYTHLLAAVGLVLIGALLFAMGYGYQNYIRPDLQRISTLALGALGLVVGLVLLGGILYALVWKSHLARALLWLSAWVGIAWLLWITIWGFWQSSRGLEAIIAALIGAALLGAIGYILLWPRIELDLDTIIMRTVEVLAAIPDLFLLIILSVLIPMEVPPAVRFVLVVTILSFVNWGGLARIIRSQVLQLREMEFAQAAQALGAGDARIIIRHVLPGTYTYLIVAVTLAIPGFILGESGLSFLGLGIQEPATSWGLMLSKAQATGITAFTERPWLLIPGLFILLAVLAYNFLGDGLRDALDPRTKV